MRNESFRESSRYTIQAVAIVICMLYAITSAGSLTFRTLNWKPIAWFGRMSFAFYLVHQIVLGEIQKHVSSKPLVLVIALVLSTLLAWGLHLAVERPALKLRNRITRASKAKAQAKAPTPSLSPSPSPELLPEPVPAAFPPPRPMAPATAD